jgi:hypothetical protein
LRPTLVNAENTLRNQPTRKHADVGLIIVVFKEPAEAISKSTTLATAVTAILSTK